MTMTSSRIEAPNAFYVRGQMCYDTHCRDIEIPWVSDFDLTQNRKLADIAILSNRFGRMAPGLYVRPDLKTWRLALNYEDVCSLLLTANSVKVIVQATAASAGPVTTVNPRVFRNTSVVPSNTITASRFDVWVVLGLEATKDAPDTTVTKTPPATTAGILQISAGPGNGIKDYDPGAAGGVVIVDADGLVSVLDPEDLIDDYKLDPVANKPAGIVAASNTDPSISLVREGTTVSKVRLAPLTDLDDITYGMVVVDVV